jgi:hypothetical protein
MITSRCIDRIIELPARDQAVCVCEAAQLALPIWEAAEKAAGIPPLGAQLLSAFQEWLEGGVNSADLKLASDRLLGVLPKNIREMPEKDLRAGFAGWAIIGVATIALEEAPDLQDCFLHTALVYAARSVAGLGRRVFLESLENLSPEETQFLCDWWERCCARFPQLIEK